MGGVSGGINAFLLFFVTCFFAAARDAPLRDLTAALTGDYSPAFVDRLFAKGFGANGASKLSAIPQVDPSEIDIENPTEEFFSRHLGGKLIKD